MAERLVRNLAAFSVFLDAASLSDGEMETFSNIAPECGVSNDATKYYFSILEDTLLAHRSSAYRKRARPSSVGTAFYGTAIETGALTSSPRFAPAVNLITSCLTGPLPRHSGGFRTRRHAVRSRGQGQSPDHPRSSQRAPHPQGETS